MYEVGTAELLKKKQNKRTTKIDAKPVGILELGGGRGGNKNSLKWSRDQRFEWLNLQTIDEFGRRTARFDLQANGIAKKKKKRVLGRWNSRHDGATLTDSIAFIFVRCLGQGDR